MVSHSDLSRLAVVDELEVGSARRARSPPSLTSRQGRRARRSRPSRARERAVLTIRCPKSAAAARGVERTDSQVYDNILIAATSASERSPVQHGPAWHPSPPHWPVDFRCVTRDLVVSRYLMRAPRTLRLHGI